MTIKINNLNNANIYINGSNFIGRASEIQMPEIKQKMKDHEGLGLYGDMEFPVGLEKLESKVKWNSYYPEVMQSAGNPLTANSLQIRSSLEERNSNGLISQKPVVVFMTGTFKSLPLGSIKKGDPVESETELSVSAIKVVIDGQTVVDIDVMANIYKVGGQDILSKFKANLGLGSGTSRSALTSASGDIPGLIVL